jgi:hypothetical protein
VNQINNYKGSVSFGVREMNETEYNNYCLNQTNITIAPLSFDKLNFTNDFSLRYNHINIIVIKFFMQPL